MASLSSSQRFWDDKARENPYWYVSSYTDYAQPDLESFWASGSRIWDEVKSHTGYRPSNRDTVVEIGCGVGRITRAIAREVLSVHAFDISQEMIERARHDAPSNIQFHCSGGDSLAPVGANTAGLVLAYLVFQHLPNEHVLAQYLHEMVRVARPGGMIAFTTSPRSWKTHALPLLRARTYLAKALAGDGPSGLHRREWTGIRPSVRTIRRLSPIPVHMRQLPNDRWLYWGVKKEDIASPGQKQ